MIWLVWRRQRAALLFALGLALLVAVVAGVGRFVAIGIGDGLGVLSCLNDPRAGYGVAQPVGVPAGVCGSQVWVGYSSGVYSAVSLASAAMLALPAVAGIVVGAGLFGRELERGTHTLALSQSTSRLRWWVTGLLVAGLPMAVAVGITTLVFDIAQRPFVNLLYRGPLDPAAFLTSGVLPVVYTLLAFGVASTAGLVLRNALAAVAVAAVVQVAVLAVLGLGWRYTYQPPETVTIPLAVLEGESAVDPHPPDGLLVDSGFLDGQGREIDQRRFNDSTDCADGTFLECMRSLGAESEFVDYQPASRYWPFQAIESGIVLALVAGSIGVGLWGLRRRVH